MHYLKYLSGSLFFLIVFSSNYSGNTDYLQQVKKSSAEWDTLALKELSWNDEIAVFDSLCGRQGNLKEAIELYNKFDLSQYSSEQKLFLINRIAKGYSDRSMSLVNPDEDRAESMNWYDKGLNLIDSIKNQNIKAVADFYNGLGVIYYFNDEEKKKNEALSFFFMAEKIYKEIIVPDDMIFYSVYLNIADVYKWNKDDVYSAEKYYKRTMGYINNIDKSKYPMQFIHLYYSLASCYRLKNDLKAGIDYYNHALEYIPLLDSKEVRDEWKYDCYTGLANIYRADGQYDESINNFLVARQVKPKDPILNNNLAICFKELGQKDMALFIAGVALEEAIRTKNNRQSAISNQIIGQIQLSDNDFELARAYLNSSLSYVDNYTQRPKSFLRISPYEDLAKVFIATKRLDEAADCIQRSLKNGSINFNNHDIFQNPDNDDIIDPVNLIDPLTTKVRILECFYKQTGDINYLISSLDCINLCDKLIERTWQSILLESSKLELQKKVESLYHTGVNISYRLYNELSDPKYIDIAFMLFEKDRYQYLLDRMRDEELFRDLNFSESLINNIKELKAKRKIVTEKITVEGVDKQLSDSLINITRMLDSIMIQLSIDYPDFPGLKLNRKYIDIKEIGEYIDNGSILIEFNCQPDTIYLIIASRAYNSFKAVAKDSNYNANLNKFKAAFEPSQINYKGFRDFADGSYYLFNKLIEQPLKNAGFEKFDNLIIIPDKELSGINFETLITEENTSEIIDYQSLKYLLEEICISYAYSSEIIKMNYSLSESEKAMKVLGFSYGKVNDNINGGSIQGSNVELKYVARSYAGKYYYNAKATLNRFFNFAGDYPVIHLALHGKAGMEQGDSTFLIFRDPFSSGGVSYLSETDFYKIDFAPELVVLSSCQTSLGKQYPGEGVYSIARAFFNSGCSSLISTLWEIDDNTSSIIMKNFYSGLSSKNSVKENLRQAKLEYLQNVNFQYEAHPRFWGAFIFQGKDRQIKLKPNPLPEIVFIAGSLLVGLAIFLIIGKRKKPRMKSKKTDQ